MRAGGDGECTPAEWPADGVERRDLAALAELSRVLVGKAEMQRRLDDGALGLHLPNANR